MDKQIAVILDGEYQKLTPEEMKVCEQMEDFKICDEGSTFTYDREGMLTGGTVAYCRKNRQQRVIEIVAGVVCTLLLKKEL